MDLNVLLPIGFILLLACLNLPIWIAIFGGLIPYFLFLEPSLPAQILMQRLMASTETTSLLAIPFFVSAGVIMNYSGISDRLMTLADALVGHLTGGLAQVNVLLSVLMGGISGSAAADAGMECKILVPEMKKRGYDEDFSAAVTIASSLITPIIPPGMGLIIFAFVTQISVGRMLAAGYLPGLLCMVIMMTYVAWTSKKHNYKGSREKPASAQEIWKAALHATWAILMPFGIIMALRFGLLTPTEAGAACAIYALFIGVVVYKQIKPKHFPLMLKESVEGTATVMALVCAANALSYFLTYERIPTMLTEMMLSMNLSKWEFLLITNILLLLLGMVMECSANILIMGPLLMPIALKLGIDPIHFGLMFVFNIGIGNMSPPFGVVLYQVAGLLNIPMNRLAKAILPFMGVMLLTLFLITAFPQISLFIPNLIYGS